MTEICPGNSRNKKRRECQYYLSWFRKGFIEGMKISLTVARLAGGTQEEVRGSGRWGKDRALPARRQWEQRQRGLYSLGLEVKEIILIRTSIILPFLLIVAVLISYLNLHCFTGNFVRYSGWHVNHWRNGHPIVNQSHIVDSHTLCGL